jgi:hypothetical protein
VRSGSAVLTVEAGLPVIAFLCEKSAFVDQGIASITTSLSGIEGDVAVHQDVSRPVRLKEVEMACDS